MRQKRKKIEERTQKRDKVDIIPSVLSLSRQPLGAYAKLNG